MGERITRVILHRWALPAGQTFTNIDDGDHGVSLDREPEGVAARYPATGFSPAYTRHYPWNSVVFYVTD
jgi:hypothetical protein